MTTDAAPTPPAAREPLWTRLFTLLAVSNFAGSCIFYLLTSTLSGWAMTSLGASATAAGLLGTAWFIGAMVARLFAGLMLARLGERFALLGSLGAMFVGTLLYPLFDSVGPLMVLRFVHGISFGLAATVLPGTALPRVPGARRGEGTAWFSFGLALASGLAPFLGSTLQRGPWGQQGVFVASIVAGALGLGAALAVSGRLKGRPEAGHAPTHRGLASLIEVSVLPIALVVMMCALAFGSLLTLVNQFGRTHGMGGAVTFYFLAYALVLLVSRPFAGVMQDRFGDAPVLIPILVATVAGVVVTATATHGAVLLVGGGLIGLGYGTLLSAGQTVALKLAGPERAGIGIGTFFLLVDLGTGIGPFVIGALVEPLGFRYALLVGAACAAVGLVGYLVVQGRIRRRERRAGEPLR